jgi:hypothetical protein
VSVRVLRRVRPWYTFAAAGGLLAAVIAFALVATHGSRAATYAGNVFVFPSPGDPVANPATQITFRGLPIGQLGQITVTGSRSGVHAGVFRADSDGAGGSFIPVKRFTAGERVTVSTTQNIVGGTKGTFSFTIATPAGGIPGGAPNAIKRVRGDVARFVSEPGLVPATVRVVKQPTRAASGDIFVAPQTGPVQSGPMILGPYGGLIWFDPLPKGQSATDLRVQSYQGQPVLTWWQGSVSGAGTGRGSGEIYNTRYQPVATVHAGNGLSADLHEFLITPRNTALVTAYYPVIWDARSVKGGGRRQIVLDSVVQEIDIPTGLVLFQWDSLAKVPVGDSYQPIPHHGRNPWDYFHINSIQLAPDGTLIVSSRDTWAIFEVNPATGGIIWELNGKHSTFRMGKGTRFAFQHDARLKPSGLITLFDDGAGPPAVEKHSHALTLRIDTRRRKATLVRSFDHRPTLLAFYEGNVQALSNGDQFVGWGQQPYFTEFNARGTVDFDARFVGTNSSYRAYRFPWTATPASPPSIGARRSHGATTVYVSWNGATQVAKWRILSGSSATSLTRATTGARSAFESALRIPAGARYAAAQALDAAGHVLGSSATIRLP